MSYNYSWYNDSNKNYYLPSDTVMKNPDILNHLEEECEARVTHDGRSIYILKNTPLPDFILPIFEHIGEYDFDMFKIEIERVNKENHFPISQLPPDFIRKIKHYTGASGMGTVYSAANKESKAQLENMNLVIPKTTIEKLIEYAREGNLPGLRLEMKRLIDKIKLADIPISCFKEMAVAAAQNGHIEIIEEIAKFYGFSSFDFDLFKKVAIESGNLKTLLWLTSQGLDLPLENDSILYKLFVKALASGNTHDVEFIMQNFRIGENATRNLLFKIIGEYGDLKTIQTVYNQTKLEEESALNEIKIGALRKGREDILSWVNSKQS